MLDLCVSWLRRGHAKLFRVFPPLRDDLRQESSMNDDDDENDDESDTDDDDDKPVDAKGHADITIQGNILRVDRTG